MKKALISITSVLMALMLLASCGKAPAAELNIGEVYQKVTDGIAMPAETVELSADDLIDYYGIEAEKVADFKAVQDACGYKDEIVILKAKNEDGAKEAEAMLKEHIEYQMEEMRDYDAEQYKVLESSMVCTNGLYVAMFISAEQSEMEEIFNSFFK